MRVKMVLPARPADVGTKRGGRGKGGRGKGGKGKGGGKAGEAQELNWETLQVTKKKANIS